MKTLLGMLVAGGLSASAWAGAIGVYGGRMATADFGEATSLGVKLEAMFLDAIGLELRGGYAYDFDREAPLLNDLRIYSVDAGLLLRLPLGEFFSLHAGAGGGYYAFPEFDIPLPWGGVFTSDIVDTFGLYALAGAELGTANFRLFAEARAHYLEPDIARVREPINPLRDIETSLSGVGVQGGLLIRW